MSVVTEDYDADLYVMMRGEERVGKTALMDQFSGRVQRQNQAGTAFANVEVVNGRRIAVINSDNDWDCVKAVIAVFDVTNRASFDSIPTHLQGVSRPGRLKVVVGNKTDLVDQRAVSREEAEQLARDENALYFETTANNHDSTRRFFQHVAKAVVGGNRMHVAASSGIVGNVEAAFGALGQHCIDCIDMLDWKEQTPMYYAAASGHASVIEALVRLGSKAIDTPDNESWTPMHVAAFNGHASAIEALVRLGSKAIDAPNNNGRTPMFFAAKNGHVSVIEVLVRLGSNAIDTPNENGRTPMQAAARNGLAHVIKGLVRLGSKAIDIPSDVGRTPMFVAALKGHVSAIEALVRLGSNAIDTPNSRGATPLFVAAQNGHVSAIETLVRLGSRAIDTLTENVRTPIFVAAVYGHVSVIETLVRLGSNAIDTPNQNDRTPTHAAAKNGHVSAIEALVRLGSKAIDTPNKNGKTPIFVAALRGHVSMIEALVRFGSTAINTPNNDGWTPMYAAATYSNHHFPETELFRRAAVIKVLKCLGGSTNIPLYEVSARVIELLNSPIDEDEVLEVRHRVYFSESLAHRLLFGRFSHHSVARMRW